MVICLRPEPAQVQARATVQAPERRIALAVLLIDRAHPRALAAALGPTWRHVQAPVALPVAIFKTFLTFLEQAPQRVQVVGLQRVQAAAMCSLAAQRANFCASVRPTIAPALKRAPHAQTSRAIVSPIDRLT